MNETLAGRIKAHRNRLGMTQQQVGERLGCTRSHMANIEDGRVMTIGADQLAELASIFGLTMDDLYYGEPVTIYYGCGHTARGRFNPSADFALCGICRLIEDARLWPEEDV